MHLFGKMAGTTYNTLNLDVEHVRPKVDSTKKVGAVAAVVVAVCVMFFAGRVYQGNVTPFTHDEVMNVAETCSLGNFIGKCVDCRECATFEYGNGGCTFFKDTYCSYCEPIPNCEREKISCSTRTDAVCLECDCSDPVNAWTDVSKEEFALIPDSESTEHSCYLGEACLPCLVCERGMYQVPFDSETGLSGACDPVNNKNTECNRCQVCQAGYYVEEACTYMSDTVCSPCTDCEYSTTRDVSAADDGHCTGLVGNNKNDVFVNGHDSICGDCTICQGDGSEFVATKCTANEDSVCDDCEQCEDDQYIFTLCEDSTDVFAVETANLVCEECSKLPLAEPGAQPIFLTYLCDKEKEGDFVGDECKICELTEFEGDKCKIGSKLVLGTDTVCEECTDITGCPPSDIRCDAVDDQTCSGCNEDETTAPQFEVWGNCCDDSRLGPKCGWEFFDAGCEETGQSFRERSAKRGGFKGETNADFVLWCQSMCDAFPTCTAFEIDDCMFESEFCVHDNSICGLKDHKNVEFGTGRAEMSCFSKPLWLFTK